MALTAHEEAEYLQLLEADRLHLARTDLNAYCRYIEIPGAPINDDDPECAQFYPDNVVPAEHHELINDALMRIMDGRIKNLMVFMPPGSAKSTYASVTFPSFYLGNRPGENIISTSYGTALARKFGRKVRSICRQRQFLDLFDTGIKKDNRAVDDWALNNEATYMCGGILSGITGNRANGLIIDDPVQGHEAADSITIRDKTWDAYQTDLRTRIKPNGWKIIIQTRWHEDDLSGRILPEDYDGESGWIEGRDGEQWYVICLQAQAERTDDPLGRDIGEWLWTDWFDEAHWNREKRAQGERNWSALYQQRPKPLEGAMIKRAWIQRYHTLPAEFIRIVQSWDTAYKDNEYNDPSVCTTWGETRIGWYLLHAFRDRMEYPALKRAVSSLAQQWEPHAILIEDKSSGQSLIQEMRAGFAVPVIAIDPKGVNKMDRLVAVSSLFEGGMVWLPESAPWLMDYESELFGYPLTTHDDQVDSTSQGLGWMFGNSGRFEAHSTGRPRVGLEGMEHHDAIRDQGYGSIGGGNDFGGFD